MLFHKAGRVPLSSRQNFYQADRTPPLRVPHELADVFRPARLPVHGPRRFHRLEAVLGDRDYAEGLLKPHNDHFRTVLRDFPDAVERNFTGDGFLVTFTSPSQAVQCALRMHDALRTHAWGECVSRHGRPPTTRIGIHLGEAIAYADTDPAKQQITGQAVDLAARIMGLAAGTQTLLTRHAFDSARQYVRKRISRGWLMANTAAKEATTRSKFTKSACSAKHRSHRRPIPIRPSASRSMPTTTPAPGDPPPACPSRSRDGWTIEKKIGEGGFGEVWLAKQKRTKERRVFKFCFDAERLAPFKRELTFFKLLKKGLGDRPDIAKLHEVQIDASPYFLESEYVEAGNLAMWVDAQGGLDKVPFEARLSLLTGIARAVAAAHSLGIIHKDFKPSNVLIKLNREGQAQPQLIDFGIGVLADRTLLKRGNHRYWLRNRTLGNRSSRTGTRLYSPPEAHLGKPSSTGFDVYALGVMLFQMATGDLHRPLGTGWQDGAATDDPLQTSLLQEDITAATHGEPAKRLASAAMLAERVEALGQRLRRTSGRSGTRATQTPGPRTREAAQGLAEVVGREPGGDGCRGRAGGVCLAGEESGGPKGSRGSAATRRGPSVKV